MALEVRVAILTVEVCVRELVCVREEELVPVFVEEGVTRAVRLGLLVNVAEGLAPTLRLAVPVPVWVTMFDSVALGVLSAVPVPEMEAV